MIGSTLSCSDARRSYPHVRCSRLRTCGFVYKAYSLGALGRLVRKVLMDTREWGCGATSLSAMTKHESRKAQLCPSWDLDPSTPRSVASYFSGFSGFSTVGLPRTAGVTDNPRRRVCVCYARHTRYCSIVGTSGLPVSAVSAL